MVVSSSGSQVLWSGWAENDGLGFLFRLFVLGLLAFATLALEILVVDGKCLVDFRAKSSVILDADNVRSASAKSFLVSFLVGVSNCKM